MADVHYNVSVYDYKRNKLCDLYDSQNHLDGQAYDIKHTEPIDGIDTLDFVIPYRINSSDPSGAASRKKEVNFRWKFLKSEYLIRLTKGNEKYWFVAQRPEKSKSNQEVVGKVHCESIAVLLRTKNIYKTFDDTNGIGTIEYLLEQVLAGTEWSIGEIDPMLEKDGVTEKIRSITTSGSEGALALVQKLCNIFRARPIFHTDTLTIDVRLMNNRNQVVGVSVGQNLNAASVTYDSKDIITRMYVEGEYGDYGYVGIDDVNPTGLSYLINFDYYKSIGVWTDDHQEALDSYLSNISRIVAAIRQNQAEATEIDNALNELIGQCVAAVYYTSTGFTEPKHTYGDPTAEQAALSVGSKVIVLNSDGSYRNDTVVTTASALIHTGDYAIAKFALPAAGRVGGKESQIAAKEGEIANLEKKISGTTKPDKIAEYNAEIDRLEDEIEAIYTETDGLYDMMSSIFQTDGLMAQSDEYQKTYIDLRAQQDLIEAMFIRAMDGMLRDGKWSNTNYIVGQEQALYDDACEVMEQMSKPSASYMLDYIRMVEEMDIPIEQIQLNAIVRVDDEELDIYDNLFITQKITGIDNKSYGEIEISNKDITLGEMTLSQLLSRMTQLSDLIDQKNAVYDRARAISKSGTFYADRLNGQIDVLKTQLLSTVSNWYTDDSGNLVFESADGGSAMMLTGAGFMISNQKDEQGNFIYRTFGTGEGFTADEIVAGFLSADRIEAGSIATSKVTPDFGETLTISNNPSITGIEASIEVLPDQIISYVGQQGYSKTFIQPNDPATEIDPETGELKYNVHKNDYWIKTEDPPEHNLWEKYKDNFTWRDLANEYTWGNVAGDITMYVRGDNDQWIETYDQSQMTEMFTKITQNEREIRLEAQRASEAEGELSATLVIQADQISSTVERTTSLESDVSRIDQKAGEIDLSVTNIISGDQSVGAVTTSGSHIQIRNDEIRLDSDGKIIANASQIKLTANKTLQDELNAKGDVTNQVQEYYVSDSQSSPTGGSWRTDTPTWSTGKYIWTRTAVTHAGGNVTYMPSETGVCIQGAKGDTGQQGPKGETGQSGSDGRGISKIEVRFKLGSSAVDSPGGAWDTWSATVPSYVAGKYYWSWTKTTFTDGTSTDLIISELGMNAEYDLAADAAALAQAIIDGHDSSGRSIKAYYSNAIQNTGITIGDTSMEINSKGNLYVNTGGGVFIRSAESTSGNPQNAVVINQSGIAIQTTGTLTAKASSIILSDNSNQTLVQFVDGKVSSIVANKTETYVSIIDPRINNTVNKGDNWLRSTGNSGNNTWNYWRSHIWGSNTASVETVRGTTSDPNKWGIVLGNPILYVWTSANSSHTVSGTNYWKETSNASAIIESQTMFEQTADYIRLEASRRESDVASLKSSIKVTADAIAAEVSRATTEENKRIEKTGVYQTAESIVSAAERYVDDELESYSTIEQTSEAISTYVGEYVDGKLENYSTITQTSEAISLYVTNNAYTIKSGIDITASGIQISGNKYIRIMSGGSFSVESGNFAIDTSGNVTLAGTITAGANSVIGGWTLGSNNLHSGSGTTYVELNSNANSAYAIWAGAEGAANAPFRVDKNGSVYLKSLKVVDDQGNWQTVNLSNKNDSYGMWKLGYHTVKSYTTNSITLSNGDTVNFNKADSVTLKGGWVGNNWTVSTSTDLYSVTLSYSTLNYSTTSVDANHEFMTVHAYCTVSAPSNFGGNHSYEEDLEVYVGTVYSDGKTAGYNSAKASLAWENGTLTVSKTNASTGTAFPVSVTISANATIAYDSDTHKYTATGTAIAQRFTRATATQESGTEAYDAGVTAGDIAGYARGRTDWKPTAVYVDAETPEIWVENDNGDELLNDTTKAKQLVTAGIAQYYNSSYWASATAENNWLAKIPNETNTASEDWDCGAGTAYTAGGNASWASAVAGSSSGRNGNVITSVIPIPGGQYGTYTYTVTADGSITGPNQLTCAAKVNGGNVNTKILNLTVNGLTAYSHAGETVYQYVEGKQVSFKIPDDCKTGTPTVGLAT